MFYEDSGLPLRFKNDFGHVTTEFQMEGPIFVHFSQQLGRMSVITHRQLFQSSNNFLLICVYNRPSMTTQKNFLAVLTRTFLWATPQAHDAR